MATPSSVTSLVPGHGRITCTLNGCTVAFSELSSTYPLKLLSPRLAANAVAIVYVMSYGGGLVCGDRIKLQVRAEGGSRLLLLSQGSTKVFKMRRTNRASTHSNNLLESSDPKDSDTTAQLVDIYVAPTSAVFLLPDPVTCFSSASYTQIQRFHLSKDSSMILLDWFTSGRKALGEEWMFERFHSVNEVIIDGRRVARDAMLLENQTGETHQPELSRPLAKRLEPYSCYAMLFLSGPLVQSIVARLHEKLRSVSVMRTSTPERVLWAITSVEDERMFMIRVAGIETEDVKGWLKASLRPLEDVIGIDTYRKTFV